MPLLSIRSNIRRLHLLKKQQVPLLFAISMFMLFNIVTQLCTTEKYDIGFMKRHYINRYIKYTLQEALQEDKGAGCDIPKIDPFDEEAMKLNMKAPNIECKEKDCMILKKLKRWSKNHYIFCLYFGTLVYMTSYMTYSIINQFVPSRLKDLHIIQKTLEHALIEDKGSGCDIPKLDPFAKEITQLDKKVPIIACNSTDWVKCIFSECSIVPEILEKLGDDDELSCALRDILFKNDRSYAFGPRTILGGEQIYTLRRSDYVKIRCKWKNETSVIKTWDGLGIGIRPVDLQEPLMGRKNTPNVLIFAFDSVSRNTFIRKLPKSYKFITEELQAVVLKKYNIVGDGTLAALFPLLTGITELEHPDCSRHFMNNRYVDDKRFIFYKVKTEGYHTAYYEDRPSIGTFQNRLNGFRNQPTDHYLRHALLAEAKIRSEYDHCFGGTPRYKMMMNLTDQFFQLDGKRFAFTFLSTSHQNPHLLPNLDEPFVEFLRGLKQDDRLKDMLLIVMGDHGCRFNEYRQTYQGKLEERLPFMSIRLPDDFTSRHPEAALNLKRNVDTLTTPFDIYATILDVIGMQEYWNNYKIEGADYARSMTLLKEIPKNRSCSEAGILPHWCSCLKWEEVKPDHPVYKRTAEALVNHINQITQSQRKKCAIRTLKSIDMVVKKTPNKNLLQLRNAKTDLFEIFLGRMGNPTKVDKQLYQVKVTLGPGNGIFEATVTHHVEQDEFNINTREISRINAYNKEPDCISATHPHLNMYCYCNARLK